METLATIGKRCSLKGHLSPREIEPEKIGKVIESACLAPSARNTQPWRFIVVREKKAVEKLVDTAFFEFNRISKQAPVVIVVCSRPGDDVNDGGKDYYLFDVGLAVENMLLAATELGLVTHLMTAFDEGEVKKVLGIPADFRVVVVTPLAYPAEASYEAAAAGRLAERTRKGVEEVTYYNKWG